MALFEADSIDAAVIALLEKGRERREAKEGEAWPFHFRQAGHGFST